MARAVAGQSEDALRQALYGIVQRDRATRERSARFLSRRGERDAIPALIDALRYRPFRTAALLDALRSLSGEDFGSGYEPWAEWMVRAEVRGPSIYRRWKADFLARLDLRFGDLLDPARPHTIAYEEIRWGGVRAEGIPSLDEPRVVPAAQAGYLSADELVFGAVMSPEAAASSRKSSKVGGSVGRDAGQLPAAARAYPLRILDWHELTNDTLGSVPVALSYCTLCGSGILFDRRVGDRLFTFATSGLLYRSNKLMFDRQTETLWSNLTGEPVVGPLVGEGIRLRVLPLVVTTWGAWKQQHPETTVLSLETGYERDYTPGQPYGEYFASPATMFPVGVRDERLSPKAWVYGIRIGEAAVAFELSALQTAGVVNTVVGGKGVVLVTGAGRAVRAYLRGDRTFLPAGRQEGGIVAQEEQAAVPAGPTVKLVASDGTRWRLTDLALTEERGSDRLQRLPGHLAYWFGWYAFFPATELWQGE
ncbi:MAG: DUF3179 domain-containing protein [Acidobacteriota bacterium]